MTLTATTVKCKLFAHVVPASNVSSFKEIISLVEEQCCASLYKYSIFFLIANKLLYYFLELDWHEWSKKVICTFDRQTFVLSETMSNNKDKVGVVI